SSVTDQNRRAAGRNHFINNHAVEASKSFNRPSSNQLREQQALYQQVLATTTTTTTTTATVTPPDATQSTTTRPLIPKQHVMKTQMDELFLQASAHTFGRVLAIVQSQYALIEHQGSLSLLALNYAQYLVVSHQLSQPPLATEML